MCLPHPQRRVWVPSGVRVLSFVPQLVKFFWKALRSFSSHERQLFLRFVWGRYTLRRVRGRLRGCHGLAPQEPSARLGGRLDQRLHRQPIAGGCRCATHRPHVSDERREWSFVRWQMRLRAHCSTPCRAFLSTPPCPSLSRVHAAVTSPSICRAITTTTRVAPSCFTPFITAKR